MSPRILFCFRGKEYAATIHLSLDDEGCYIFSFLHDAELVLEFGTDIDIYTDFRDVLPGKTLDKELIALKEAILEAAKKTPEFRLQKLKWINIGKEQLN